MRCDDPQDTFQIHHRFFFDEVDDLLQASFDTFFIVHVQCLISSDF